jgi:hypothetical protein
MWAWQFAALDFASAWLSMTSKVLRVAFLRGFCEVEADRDDRLVIDEATAAVSAWLQSRLADSWCQITVAFFHVFPIRIMRT